MLPKTTVRVPLSLLAAAPVHARLQERVRPLVLAYQSGPLPPPIPVHLNRHGALLLDADGNHRLAAARVAGVAEVEVAVDSRNVERLTVLAALAREPEHGPVPTAQLVPADRVQAPVVCDLLRVEPVVE